MDISRKLYAGIDVGDLTNAFPAGRPVTRLVTSGGDNRHSRFATAARFEIFLFRFVSAVIGHARHFGAGHVSVGAAAAGITSVVCRECFADSMTVTAVQTHLNTFCVNATHSAVRLTDTIAAVGTGHAAGDIAIIEGFAIVTATFHEGVAV